MFRRGKRGKREAFRRRIRGKGPMRVRDSHSKKREGEIMRVAKRQVITIAPTTPVQEGIKIMVKEGFRRIPIADPGTRKLSGIVTATDIINYLGGGEKFKIIQTKFNGNFFKAFNEAIKTVATEETYSILTSANLTEAIVLMKTHGIGGLPVVDEEKRVWAIITERDLASFFAGKIRGVKVSEVMSKKVVTANPETSIFNVEKTMINQGFRRLPLVIDERIVGIVTVMDILRFFGSSQVFKNLQSGLIEQVLQTSINELATKRVITVKADADVGDAASIMRKSSIGALPVVIGEKLVGIVTERDFFKLIE